MNYSLLSKLLGAILGFTAVALFSSSLIGFIYKDNWMEWHAIEGLAISGLACGGTAAILFWQGSGSKGTLYRKEGLALIGISWLVSSFFGALPYYLILPECQFIDAWFEAVSGITTTGASVFTDFEKFPRSLLFWRCLSQWIGGLGVAVLFVALLGSLGAGAKILFSNESSGTAGEIAETRVQKGAFKIIQIYVGLTVCCGLSLYFFGLDPYDAICHAFTTLSTGGFSTQSRSIEGFQNHSVEWVIIFFMLLGGTSFLFLLKIFNQEWSKSKKHSEVMGFYSILIGASVSLFLFLGLQFGFSESANHFRHAVFQAVSILSGTGFSCTDFALWDMRSGACLLLLMAVGGCTASTAGGLKVLRVMVSFKLMVHYIERAFRSQVIRNIQFNRKVIQPENRESIMTYLGLCCFIVACGFFLLSILEPDQSFGTLCSATFASFFNVGPGLEAVGPSQTYAFLSAPSKFLLSFLMILGRLELLAILVLFVPSLWKQFK